MSQVLKEQINYAKKNNSDKSFIDASNFLESERESGYKNTVYALYELIDNSYEAQASKIFITAKNKPGTNHPNQIAVIDNGEGMGVDDEGNDFLYEACKVGGTHRESSKTPLKRKGYGRFGFGLPKSSISQTRSFTVFTKVKEDQNWRSLNVDLDELISKNSTELNEIKKISSDELPDYIRECLKNNFSEDKSGTIVAWNDCDRMTYKTEESLKQNLGWRVSMAYWRNIKSGFSVNILGDFIKPIDPLFLDKSCEHVENCGSNKLKAIEYETWNWPFKVKSEGKEVVINAVVRAARFPFRFGSKDIFKEARGQNGNIRQKILREHNGILFYREGRYIDCMRHVPSEAKKTHRFQPYDQNYKIEVNFPASLDEPMGVTNNKQFVNLRFPTLQSDGFVKLMEEANNMYNDVKKSELDIEVASLSKENAAAQAIDAASDFFEKNQTDPIQEQKRKRLAELAAKNLDDVINLEVERRKKKFGEDVDKEKVKAEITPLYTQSKTEFKFDNPGPNAPFFRVVPVGGKREYYINQDHSFFTKIWMNPRSNEFMRESLKLVIAAIGDEYVGAVEDGKRWYNYEMVEWSRNLNNSSDQFIEKFNLDRKEDES